MPKNDSMRLAREDARLALLVLEKRFRVLWPGALPELASEMRKLADRLDAERK